MEKLNKYLNNRAEHAENNASKIKQDLSKIEHKDIKYSDGYKLGYWVGVADAHRDTLEVTSKQSDQDKIALMQYENLRKLFRQLTEDVLGEGYWNMGMDVYECDEITCEHLRKTLKRGWFK